MPDTDKTNALPPQDIDQLLPLFLNFSSEAIFLALPDAQIIYANKQAIDRLGYSETELLSMTIPDLDPNSPAHIWLEHWADLKKAKKMLIETEHRSKNGYIFPVEVQLNYVRINGREYNLAFARDITEKKETEARLRNTARRNSQLAAAINSASIGVIITDPNLHDNPIIFVNPAFTTITGYTGEDVFGKNHRILQGEDSNPETVAQINQAILNKESCTVDILNYRQDDTPFWNHLTLNPVFDELGTLTNYVGLLRDVTQRELLLKQAEHQARRLALLNEMATELNQAQTLSQILNIMSKKTYAIIEADRASVSLLNERKDTFEIFALRGSKGALALRTNLPAAETSSGLAVQEKKVINTPDISQSEKIDLKQLAEQGLGSTMSAPLIVGKNVLGTINMGHKNINAYTESDVVLIRQIASLLATIIENRRLLQEAQTRVRQEQILRQITSQVRASVDVESVMRNTVQEIGQALDRPAFAFLNQESLTASENSAEKDV